MTPEIPDWVTETPLHTFNLCVFDQGGGSEQEIEITREEYIALKAHLAAIRGYGVGSVEESVSLLRQSDKLDAYNCEDDQQVAMHLGVARDVYRAFPSTVVFQSAAFDAELEAVKQ